MNRVLVIAPQFVGDSILAVTFLRELKKHYGRIEIDVISKNAGLLIFSKCPYVAKVYDIKKLDYKELWQNKYSKAYVLKRSLSAAIIAVLSGAKERIGFGGQFREPLLTNVVKYNKNENKHELEHFMDVLRADYVEINSNNLEYYVDDTAKNSVKNYFSDKKKALFVACSSTDVKNWTQQKFAEVAKFLDTKGYEIFFVGLEKEKVYCDEIIDFAQNTVCKNLCGKLTFDEITALISEMDIVFGVDSGFCHMASAFGKNVVVLFGPTSISQWKPLGKTTVITANLPCAPCAKPKKCINNYACMNNISSESVIEKLEKVL